MINVCVMYPYVNGSEFDFNYYLNKHIPMVREVLGDALKRISVDFGLAEDGNLEPVFVAMAHLYFDSVDSFKQSFVPQAERIHADIANYTDLKPIIQVSDIRL
ncbi:MAG: ethD [Rhodocyclaceae bacterium]|nr:MAG: ethD [Rhodocyclaceae bacterium]